MKTLKEIMDEYNVEVEFPFLGNALIVSKERNIYNQLRIKYNEIADRASVTFQNQLMQFKDVKDLLDGVAKSFLVAMKEGLDEISKDAISVNCYTIDTEAAVKLCIKEGYFDSYDKAYEEYRKAYLNIMIDCLNKYDALNGQVANRPRLEVSTIGGSTLDAIGNQLQADFTNAVAGKFYSDFNTLQFSEEIDKAEKLEKQLFNNQQYRNELINSVWMCTANLRLLISGYLNNECKLGLGGWITNSDTQKAESIYNNMKSIALPDEKQREFALSILQLNPYNYNYYKTFISKYLDNAKEILAISDFFHINLSNSLKSIVNDFAKEHMGSSFDDVKNCRSLVKSKITELGFPDNSYELAEKTLQEHSAVLLSNYLKDNMGETRKETIACYVKVLGIADDIDFDENYSATAYLPFEERMEVLDNELVAQLAQWITDNIGTTEEEAHRCREELDEQIKEQELNPEKATDLYKTIDNRLKKLDEEYRTVEGFTFPTRESADETKRAIDANKDILYKSSVDFIFRNDYIAHIGIIKSLPLVDKLKFHFAEKYERLLKEFDKKCKNAKLYDDKIKGQKKSLKSFARSLFVSDDKQQKDWEEVTHNGKYDLSSVMGLEG